MTNENRKFFLVLWVIAVMIFYLVRIIPLFHSGDSDAAIVYTLGMGVMTLGMIGAAKLGENARKFKVLLSIAPAGVLIFILASAGISWLSWERNSSHQLHKAALQGERERVVRLLEKYGAENLNLQWALEGALLEEHLELIGLLIEKGADINGNVWAGNTALEYTLFWDKPASFLKVLEYKPDLTVLNDNGMNILHKAIQEQYSDLVPALLEAGMDGNDPNRVNGWTPLHYAAEKGNREIAELLIARGCDVNPLTVRGRTPLMLLDRYGHEKMRELFLQNGAWDIELNSIEQTPLHKAAEESNISEMQRLLKEGRIIIDFPDENGDTPLSLALKSGSDRAVLFLLDQGADIQGNGTGRSPLTLAVSRQRSLFLLEAMLDRGAGNDEDSSPLEEAVLMEDLERTAFLLERDFTVTPGILKAALKYGSPEVQEALIPYASWEEMEEGPFLTVLERAVSDGNVSLVQDLLNRRGKALPGNTGNMAHNPLVAAARYADSSEMMDMLVNAGASLESKDQNGWDLFLFTFREDHSEVLAYLLDHYPFPEEETRKQISDWLLYECIDSLAVESTRMLLNRGSDIHTTFADPSQTNEKASVLHLIGNGRGFKRDDKPLEDREIQDLQKQMIRLLVEQGADLDAEETTGQTPLEYWEENDAAIFELLQPYYS